MRTARQRKGSTLIVALWALFLLTTFAVQMGAIVRQRATVVHRLDDRESRHSIAEAGVKTAIVQLRKEDVFYDVDFLGERWSEQPETFKDIRVGKGSFTVGYDRRDGEQSRMMYGLQDEESKININKASFDVILSLLEQVSGLQRSDAEELAYCLVDWRDADSFFQHPQYGAEDADYQRLKEPYEAKDGNFEVLEELLLVHKMDQEVFDKIRYFVTIYGEGRININTAPGEVLLAIGLSPRAVDDIVLFRKGADTIDGTADDEVFLQTATIVPRLSQVFDMAPGDISVLNDLIATDQFVTKSEHFMIYSTARLDGKKGQTTIMAVARRSGQITYWREEM